VGGGDNNTVQSVASAVVAGKNNLVGPGMYSFVGAGIQNTAGPICSYCFVGSGQENTVMMINSVVVGGKENTARGFSSAVVAGEENTAKGSQSFVGAGLSNVASGIKSFVGVGNDNTASFYDSFVGGGSFNSATNRDSVVVGGFQNDASGLQSFVVAGKYNVASGDQSAALGSYGTASASYSAVFSFDNSLKETDKCVNDVESSIKMCAPNGLVVNDVDITKSISDLETSVASKDAALQSDVVALQSDVATLETDNVMLESKITSLENKITSLEAENQSLQSQLLLLGILLAPSLVERVGPGVCTDSAGVIYDRSKSKEGGWTWEACAKEAVVLGCPGFEMKEENGSRCILLFDDGKAVLPSTAFLNPNHKEAGDGPIQGADANSYSEFDCYKNLYYSPSP